MPTHRHLCSCLTILSIAAVAPAQEREVVLFELDHTPAFTSRGVFVLGDLPELGGSDILQAVKLQSTDGSYWSVNVSLPVGRTFEYQYYERITVWTLVGNPLNATPIGSPLVGATADVEVFPATKSIHYHSRLAPPLLFWRQDEGEFQATLMSDLGPGRRATERRWLAPGIGASKRFVEFYFTDESGTARDPQAGSYATDLDELFVQDGAIYTYAPHASPSPLRRDYDPANIPSIDSVLLGETRHYRVMLPRGYDEHGERRYPVMYMYDGQLLWDDLVPSSPALPSGWEDYDTDAAGMAELVRSGAVGEIILVAIEPLGIPITCEYAQNRLRDGLSPEDTLVDFAGFGLDCPGTVQGMADLFGEFIRDELKPLIDAQYRTLTGREHTFAQGFSAGGSLALYLGWDFTDTFGAIGAQTAGFIVQENFTARIMAEPWRDVRIYLDSGTAEWWNYDEVMTVRDNLVGKSPPYVEEGDIRLSLGYNQLHTFIEAGSRQGEMMTFLYPATMEPPQLFLEETYCASTPSSTGTRAEIEATGSASVAANDAILHALYTPPDSLGLFIVGESPAQIPFANGVLCISPLAPGVQRLFPIRRADVSGVASLELDVTTLPGDAVSTGSTRYFQYLFRDQAAGGAGFNTSDGLALTFQP